MLEEFKKRLESFSVEIAWVEYTLLANLDETGIWGLIKREYLTRKSFIEAFHLANNNKQVNQVFLPYIDYCLYGLGIIGSAFENVKFGGICMRPAFHYQASGVIAPRAKFENIKNIVFNRLLRHKNLNRLFSIDKLLVEYVKERTPSHAHRLGFLPDPADEPHSVDISQIRVNLNTPLNAKVILVYGAIDRRKGIEILLDTLETKSGLSEWHIWLIGRQSKDVRDLLSGDRWIKLKSTSRIQTCDAFVSWEIENQVFGACDWVWAVYQRHYAMSGVIVRAGMHKKPIVGCSEGLIGWHIKNNFIGKAINIPPPISGGLIDEIEYDLKSTFGENGYLTFHGHTWKNFQKIIVSEIS